MSLWAGADSLDLAGKVKGASTDTMATILGGTGADTLDFNGTVQHATILGGTDAANTFNFSTTVDDSTIRGGTGADSLTVTGVASNALFAGGAAADEFTFSSGSTATSIYAGAGNDSVIFSASTKAGTGNTYFFGASDGADYSPLRYFHRWWWSDHCGRRSLRCNFWPRLVCWCIHCLFGNIWNHEHGLRWNWHPLLEQHHRFRHDWCFG